MIYNPYPQVDLPFGNDNKLFRDLFESIMRVNERFVTYKVKSSENKWEYELHLERVFAYELYRQWANIIESKGYPLVLNAEICKTINFNDITYEDNGGTKHVTLYPDLVLHHSQADDKAQGIICELKRNHKLSGGKIFGDLFKIVQYLREGVFNDAKPFKYGTFMIIGGSLSIIKEEVDKDPKIQESSSGLTFNDFVSNNNELFKRIVCIAYDGTVLEYELLSELIQDKLPHQVTNR